ncbi:MAG: sulfur carrier protein ThiS [Fibrobacter sp.]|nr:sulfur carrier protein ThiS [Fibrobacter sp.]
MSIRIILNGVPEEVSSGMTMLGFLQSRSINPSHVVVEVNKSIVNRERFADLTLNENDLVEVLRFVGGG